MGSKLSSASDSETLAESAPTGIPGSVGGLNRHHRHHHYHRHHASSSSGARSRARSFGGVTHREAGASSSAALDIDVGGLLDLERPRSRSVIAAGSVPVRVFPFGKISPFISQQLGYSSEHGPWLNKHHSSRHVLSLLIDP